jgi:hypothetical protein
MNSDVQIRLLRSVHACMRPIARILLRSGITYRQFADIAKLAFVQEAFSEPERTGAKTNISRVAVQTGMSRKDVARTFADSTFSSLGLEGGVSPAARILQTWHTDTDYTDTDGNPKELPLEGPRPSFADLVDQVASDVTPGSVKAELEKAIAIEETFSGSVRALKRHFVPGDISEELLIGLRNVLYPVVEGLARNVGPERRHSTFIQRFAYTDRLDMSSVSQFRKLSRDRAIDFMRSIDDWLSAHEIPAQQLGEQQTHTAGLGVYYYDDATATSEADQKERAG